jgi:hypothetical protein
MTKIVIIFKDEKDMQRLETPGSARSIATQ